VAAATSFSQDTLAALAGAALVSREEMPIRIEDDVILVRTKARELAERLGFDPFATAAVVTASSELGRNVWRHAGGGRATFFVIERAGRVGIKIDFDDDGPGIADVGKALAGGNSTVRSLGLGLAGSKRLADELALESTVGKGTHVSFLKWKRR
jgi:serine/threonine-protein kinase RsbT